MRRFIEEFPSLKGKGTDDIKVDCMNELIFHYTDVQKNCFDKQKVREAIKKLRFTSEIKKGDKTIISQMLYTEELLKELNLGDEE